MTTSPTSDLALLLRAVLTDPADLTARLIYADCLEEQNTPPARERAAFIRAGVELESTETHGSLQCPCRGCRLHQIIEAAHAARDAVLWRSLPWGMSARIDWRAGFLFTLRATTDQFLAHAGAIFGAHPITSVTLTDREPNRYPDWAEAAERAGRSYWHELNKGEAILPGTGINHRLPSPVFAALTGGDRLMKGRARFYLTADAAHQALSRACVAYGRTLANLPPLNEATPA